MVHVYLQGVEGDHTQCHPVAMGKYWLLHLASVYMYINIVCVSFVIEEDF